MAEMQKANNKGIRARGVYSEPKKAESVKNIFVVSLATEYPNMLWLNVEPDALNPHSKFTAMKV